VSNSKLRTIAVASFRFKVWFPGAALSPSPACDRPVAISHLGSPRRRLDGGDLLLVEAAFLILLGDIFVDSEAVPDYFDVGALAGHGYSVLSLVDWSMVCLVI
jgi:hypothetical protein